MISTAASASGAPTWTTDVIDERTIIDARTQLETDVPVNYADQAHNWTAEGLGDIYAGAAKREMLFSSLADRIDPESAGRYFAADRG